MFSIHIICRRGEGVKAVTPPVYESGTWDLSVADAEKLIGGMLYLHETKGSPAYFGGRVEAFREVEVERAHAERIVFRLHSLPECKGKKWRGCYRSSSLTAGSPISREQRDGEWPVRAVTATA